MFCQTGMLKIGIIQHGSALLACSRKGKKEELEQIRNLQSCKTKKEKLLWRQPTAINCVNKHKHAKANTAPSCTLKSFNSCNPLPCHYMGKTRITMYGDLKRLIQT